MDVLLKGDNQFIKKIDQNIKSSKFNRRISIIFGILLFIILLSLWIVYKIVLIRIYNFEKDIVVKNIIYDKVIVDTKKANSEFNNLKIFIPSDLEKSKEDFYGLASNEEVFYASAVKEKFGLIMLWRLVL